MRTVTLKRLHQGEAVSVYHGDDGAKWFLKTADREYGTEKSPSHYLTRQGDGDEKPRYVSGLFQTDITGLLSGDFKDALGVRNLFVLEVLEKGAQAVISPGRAPKRAAAN